MGLGGNLGPTHSLLCRALDRLDAWWGPLDVAPFYGSRAVGPVEQPDFLNTVAVANLPGAMHARQLLARLKALEAGAGRELDPSVAVRFGPRPLDIDVLLAGAASLDLPVLAGDSACVTDVEGAEGWPGAIQVPHPRLHIRRFVLQPLADLRPELRLRLDGEPPLTVAQLLARLAEPSPRSAASVQHVWPSDNGWTSPREATKSL